MNTPTRFTIILAMIWLGALYLPLSLAQNSVVKWHAFDMGFSVPRSSTNSVKEAPGQTFVGRSQFANIRVTSGFFANPLLRRSTVTTVGVPVALGWNIVSLPVSSPIPDDSVRHLYVNSVNPYAFAFIGGYVQQFTMTNGLGYWVKSSANYTQDITGTTRDTLTVPVSMGWNMIGSISSPIDTSATYVTPSAPGLRVSNFFRYNSGYVVAITIDPGFGYWVKASSAGSFFMHRTSVSGRAAKGKDVGRKPIENLNTLVIEDASGAIQTLYFGSDANEEILVKMYVMPPPPPQGSFDVRFVSDEGGTMVRTHLRIGPESSSGHQGEEGVIEMPIAIQSSAYPLSVTWKIGDADVGYELTDGEGTTQTLHGEGKLEIRNDEVNRLVLRVMGSGNGLPREFALYQNYPNPFNPTTNIKFALPVASRVGVVVYNVLGQVMRTLLNEERKAGYHTIEWNGTSNNGLPVSSGVYFMRLQAHGDGGSTFSDVKKLMIVR